MSSIHELSAIISQLELRVNNFKTPNPTDKQKALLEAQVRLIAQLQDIYQTVEGMSLYDTFIEVQNSYNTLKNNGCEMDGLFIKIYFKEAADYRKFGLIDCVL